MKTLLLSRQHVALAAMNPQSLLVNGARSYHKLAVMASRSHMMNHSQKQQRLSSNYHVIMNVSGRGRLIIIKLYVELISEIHVLKWS